MDRLICRVILKRFPTTTILMVALAALLLSSPAFPQEGPPSLPATPSPDALSQDQIQKAKEMLKQQTPEKPAEKPAPPGKAEIPPPPVERALSPFEAYIQGKSHLAFSKEIRQFGYDLFERFPVTFAPADMIPVGPNYLLGPGDELQITLWGKFSAEHTAEIDREGKIRLPPLGVLFLSGLTFSEAKLFLERELSRYYKPSEVRMNVGMGRLRSITNFVVGNAQRPGSYTLSSLSTLINALFAAGGPSKAGSLRDIQVKRNGETVVHFDLYDFLLKGDKTKDIRLMPEDVIFIPPVGPLVGIAGNVKSPAIYEAGKEIDLHGLIEMAGGIAATGYLQRIQIERIFDNQAKIVLDLNLKELAPDRKIPLKDGDLVKIFSIIEAVTNAIELKGNLVRPGVYEWREGLRVKDLIKGPEELLPDTFWDFALIERLIPPDHHKEYFSFHPGKLLLQGDASENIPLMPHDTLVVFNRWDLMENEKARVAGAVNKPGSYDFRPNMRLSDLIKLAGGLKRHAMKNEAEMTRIAPTPEGPHVEKIIVNLEKALEKELQHDLLLREDDFLFVRAVPEWHLYRTVQVQGEVRFPGTYTSEKGETLSSLIARAGGYTENAYLKGAVFTRESVRALQQRQLNDSIDRLEQQLLSQSAQSMEASLTPEAALQQTAAMEQKRALIAKMRAAKAMGRISLALAPLDAFKDSASDLPLAEGDVLFIPERPQQVQVIGAVYNSTAFIYNKKATVASYIKKAGGMTEHANDDEAYLLKVDGTAISNSQTGGFFGGGFMSSNLDPGDTIVAPEETERVAWLREVKDITQILYQIAVTAGVLIVAF